MFFVSDNSIHVTRGDIGSFEAMGKVSADEYLKFNPGDIIRFKVFQAKRHDLVVLEKDIVVNDETQAQNYTAVIITLSSNETRIGDLINSPVEYWYEIERNPDTACQTIIGYDTKGPKIFKVYPEGGRKA